MPRPKGSKNIKNIQWERLGEYLTRTGARRAMQIMSKLPDDKYLDSYMGMLKYFKPSLQAVKSDVSVEVNPINNLTDEQLESRIAELINRGQEVVVTPVGEQETQVES